MAYDAARPWRLRTLSLLLPLILLTFVLRLYHLDSFSFWTDEGLTPLRAGYSLSEILSNRIIIQEGITRDTHPPLFYLLIHFTRLLWGESDFAYRYPSLLAGVLLVPLLFQLGRRLHNFSLGWIAALLTAVNPLQIWYSHEARMYTLLVLLAAAATYVLWRGLTRPDAGRYLLMYLVLAGLAVYTHYTAAFLIAAQGLFWAWLLWHRGQRRLLLAAGAVALLAAVPLVPFTVPRLFAGAEASYFYVAPLTMLQDVVRAFSLGVTADFHRPPIQLLALIALVLLLLGLYAARTWLRRTLLLLYLLATVLGLMAGSLLIKPMYQGARHIMIDSPALLLLVAWGIVYLWQQTNPAGRSLTAWVYRGSALLAGMAMIVGAVLSLHNLYHNPTYAKDDFRALARYVEQRAGERDIIVYNNAILLPLHTHYQVRSDVAVTALPVYPHLATDVAAQLAGLAQTYERIWFVTDPPADKRDDDRLVRRWLDEHLAVVDERSFHARTTVVEVVTYATAPQVLAQLPADSQPLAWQWDGLPSLAGVQLQFSQPAALPTLWLDLFWQGGASWTPAVNLRFSLRDPDGREWLVQEKKGALDHFTDKTWPTDGLVRQSYFLPVAPGTPPGTYALLLQPTGTDGSPPGEVQVLADIELAATTAWPVQPEQPATTPIRFDNGLTLAGITTPVQDVRPGHTLPFTLYWQASEPMSLDGIRYQLEVVGPDGTVLRQQGDPPGPGWLAQWPADVLVRHEGGLYFPPETQPGQYRLRWQLQQGEAVIPGRPSWRPWFTDSVYQGTVEVRPWPLVTTLPEQATLQPADFGPAIHLYGYDLRRPADDSLRLTLFWQVKAPPGGFYATFIHLVSAATGEIVTQTGFIPVDGVRPTSGWRAGEVLTDPYTLTLPADLLPGEYHLNVGFYNPDSGERLPVLAGGTEPQPHNQLTLTTITLP